MIDARLLLMLVDDSPEVALQYGQWLLAAGYRVAHLRSCESGIAFGDAQVVVTVLDGPLPTLPPPTEASVLLVMRGAESARRVWEAADSPLTIVASPVTRPTLLALAAMVASPMLPAAPLAPEAAGAPARQRGQLNALTPRESQVLDALFDHHRVATVATALAISQHTVRNHLKALFRKTGTGSQVSLLAWYREQRLGSGGPSSRPGAKA